MGFAAVCHPFSAARCVALQRCRTLSLLWRILEQRAHPNVADERIAVTTAVW